MAAPFVLTTRTNGAYIKLVTDQALSVQYAEEFVRQFSVPATWNSLRLGVLLSPGETAGEDLVEITNTQAAFGLCNGTAAPYGNATATHFVGTTLTNGALKADATILFSAYNRRWVLDYDSYTSMGKIVDGVVTNGSSGSATLTEDVPFAQARTATPLPIKRKALYLDFIKGTPNWTIRLWADNYTGEFLWEYDTTPAQFSAYGFDRNPPESAYGGRVFKYRQVQLAVDEATDGALNCINFYWGPQFYEICIHQIELWRMT